MASVSTLIGKARRVIGKSYRLADDLTDRWIARHFVKDHRQWPHHVLHIAGLPKSGTNWMAQLLESVPGYKVRKIYDASVWNHDVSNAVFDRLPWDLYSVVKLHTRFTPENIAIMRKYKLRTVLMYRDLRDQCVSRYFHVLNEASHRHHALYKKLSNEEGLSHCIEVILEDSVPWVRDWLKAVKQDPDWFFVLRYEELHADPVSVFGRVLKFYEIELPDVEIQSIVQRVRNKTKFDLRSNLRWGKGTARKGIVGDWRNYFTDKHVARFKETCGEFLVELGYERDFNWTR